MGPGDDRLLERAQRRESAALAELVDRYAPRVHGLIYRLTRARDVAEELTQETFLRVVRTIEEYVDDGRFEAWLFRIAANLARDHARKSSRRGAMASLEAGRGHDGAVREPPDGRGVEPARILAEEEQAERLNACLGAMPEADREILLLRHFSELSFQEIADLLEIPLGTALARAHRALKRLRAAFAVETQP